jgi:hypothetical protein
MALLIKLRVSPHKLLCDFSSESCTVTERPEPLLERMIGGKIGNVCVPSGPVMVTSRCARGDDGGRVGEIEVGGKDKVTDCGSVMGSDPIWERRDVDAWNDLFIIGMKVVRELDMMVGMGYGM